MKSIAIAALVFAFAAEASAQWAKFSDPSLPHRDGKVNLTAPTPKAPDGKPDLSGMWTAEKDPTALPPGVQTVESITGFVPPKYFVDITKGMKPEDVVMTPAAAALFKQRASGTGAEDPIAHCKPTGVPALYTIPIPYKIVQTPKSVLILYEEGVTFRQIFLDGRRPVQDPQPTYMGYSTGRWEGDTLVVDTVGFNGKAWLDRMGHPSSDALRLTERIRRPNLGNLEIAITINDPKMYVKPLNYTLKASLEPENDLMEYFCTENEKDAKEFQ